MTKRQTKLPSSFKKVSAQDFFKDLDSPRTDIKPQANSLS